MRNSAIKWRPHSQSSRPSETNTSYLPPTKNSRLATHDSQTQPATQSSKFVAFESGELHLTSVDMQDLRRTYGCRLRNATTRRTIASSNMAQLILMDSNNEQASSQAQQVQLLHSVEQLIVPDWDASNELAAQEADHQQPDSQLSGFASSPSKHHHRRPSPPSPPTPVHSTATRQRLLLLPCAVRLPASPSSNSRWLYQAPSSLSQARPLDDQAPADADSRRPLQGLNQLASQHKGWLQLVPAPKAESNHSSASVSSMQTQSRIIVGPTYLAIERPRAQLSGRYLFQVEDPQQRQEPRTVCDINVIVRWPLRLQMSLGHDGQDSLLQPVAEQLLSGEPSPPRSLSPEWLPGWLSSLWPVAQRTTSKDRARRWARWQQQDPTRIAVSGPGSVPQTPIVRIGDRLELSCIVRGQPLESVRWFRQGQVVNVQSSSDFQTEIALVDLTTNLTTSRDSTSSSLQYQAPMVSSRLLIRQLQPRDFGLQIFECFAQNSLGDRARASLAIYVAEREQLDEAQAQCPLELELEDNSNSKQDSLPEMDTSEEPSGRSLLRRHNPFRQTLVLEGEPIDLQCPNRASGPNSNAGHHQIDWFKWAPPSSAGK